MAGSGMQVWKANVLPHLKEHLAANVSSVVTYLVLFHEVAIANLLEVGTVDACFT